MNIDTHVDCVGQSSPMPHNEGTAEHKEAAEHDTPEAPCPSLTREANVAAGDGGRAQEPPAPRTSEHHQMVLSFDSAQPASTSALTFSHPASTTIPLRKESVRCALCVQALCKHRFECNGRINRAWCRCNHPPLVGTKKVRLSEVEVKRRIALLEAGQGSSHA